MAAKEAKPFLLRADPLVIRMAAMKAAAEESSPVSMLESRFAREAELDLCLKTLEEMVSAGGLPVENETQVTSGCLRIAESAAATSPLESNFWFLAATLATRLGDLDSAVVYLKASYEAGPNEQWIAERRALFVYALHARLDSEMERLLDQDFGLLLRTERGLDVLAARYIVDASLRERLVTIAETLAPEYQERFLDRIEDQLNQRQTFRSVPEPNRGKRDHGALLNFAALTWATACKNQCPVRY
ncbi:MAG: hypothetical protein KDK07_03815 [Bauldia sp.]|nr:hypothetical protein [Bauldia sp.]